MENSILEFLAVLPFLRSQGHEETLRPCCQIDRLQTSAIGFSGLGTRLDPTPIRNDHGA